jgi:hypothetical protein
MTDPSPRWDGRRPRSAKARNRRKPYGGCGESLWVARLFCYQRKVGTQIRKWGESRLEMGGPIGNTPQVAPGSPASLSVAKGRLWNVSRIGLLSHIPDRITYGEPGLCVTLALPE